ncbi:WD40-repeat-containing domain protein [Obelidium mucronatum]|nr:WD40-repeat-containing domain protein [Obelidium mucronatum]
MVATTKDLTKGTIRELRSGHRSKILSVAWSATGSRFASGGYDQLAKVFTLGDCSASRIRDAVAVDLKAHTADIDQVKWHPSDDNILCTTGADKTLRLWDVRSPAKPKTVINTVGENINIAWSPDGNTIAVGNKDDVISFIDPREPSNYVWHSLKRDFEINEIRWDYSGSLFYLTTGHGTVQILDFPSLKPGRYFAIGSSDSLVTLWDMDEMVCVRTLGQIELICQFRAMSFTHCGELLACSTSDDKFIDISSVETGESLHTISVGSPVDTLSWHPSKYILAYSGEDVFSKAGRGGNDGSLIGIYSL